MYHEIHPKEFGEDFIDFTKIMTCQGKAKKIYLKIGKEKL